MKRDQSIILNAGQKAAANGFFEFLLVKEEEVIISGPGGVGKTFTMGYMIDEIMPRYVETCKMMGIKPEYDDVVMCATTNKAAEVLALATGRPTQTIHSFLNLKVVDDYSNGKSNLSKTGAWTVHRNKIIFVDECSMIDSPLRNMLMEGTFNCKIVYVGDHCQLAPVMELLSPIYRDNLRMYKLTEPMRNAGQPALLEVCQQLRDTVEQGVFNPIKIVPGVIDYMTDEQMQAEVDRVFIDPNHDGRILAYTNNRVIQYNDHIRDLRGLPMEFTTGETLVNNSAVRHGKGMISVEQEVKILSMSSKVETVHIRPNEELAVRYADLEGSLGREYCNVPIPVERDHYDALLKYYRAIKAWSAYFELKNKYPDLRQRDASTVHKSQGSSYGTVYIDLANLSTCRNPDLAARLLYVAFTRARNRVVLYGNLVEKFGGLLI